MLRSEAKRRNTMKFWSTYIYLKGHFFFIKPPLIKVTFCIRCSCTPVYVIAATLTSDECACARVCVLQALETSFHSRLYASKMKKLNFLSRQPTGIRDTDDFSFCRRQKFVRYVTNTCAPSRDNCASVSFRSLFLKSRRQERRPA